MGKSDPKEVELQPDTWERFERAVDVVTKSPRYSMGQEKFEGESENAWEAARECARIEMACRLPSGPRNQIERWRTPVSILSDFGLRTNR
jgi:hypothetical protein